MGADPNAFIAPQTGYEQSWAVDLKDGGTTQILFVRSRAGRAHTRLVLEAEPWIGKGVAYLTLNYCVNPTGSRNLQPGGGRFASHELPRLDVQTWPGAVAKQDDDD